MADPTQTTANAPDLSQVNPQALAALMQVIQSSQQQQQPPMSTPTGTNQTGAQMLAGQGAYQQGAQKALKEAGYAHTQQALQAGMPPDQIQNHGLMTGSQQNPAQTLQSILPPTNPVQSPGYNPQTGNIQEGGVLNRMLRGFAGGGIPGLLGGMAGPNATQQMEGLKTAQVLKAGQPAEIALPQAQANEAQGRGNYFNALASQTNQIVKRGGPPLSPEQKGQYIAGLNNLKMEQVTKLQDSLKDQIESNSKTLDDLISKEPQSKKSLDHTNWAKQVQETQNRIQHANILMGMTSDRMQQLQFTNPITGQNLSGNTQKLSQEIIDKAPAGATHYDPPSGQYYNAQGQVIK